MKYRMDHIVLNVKNMDAMIKFYAEVLHLPPERLEAYNAGDAPFPSVRMNTDTIIDLFPKTLWQKTAQAGPGRVNLNHFCLAMEKDEWENLRDRLDEHHIKIVDGPGIRWGAHGNGTSIYFRDPEENLIEARYYSVKD